MSPTKILYVALTATFLQQTVIAGGRILPAVIAPAIIADLKFDAAWLGPYMGLYAFAALIVQMSCGSFIVRHGALRVSQIAVLVLGLGTAVTVQGSVGSFILAACLAGAGGAVSTPASSHLLGRYASPQYAPLVFSVKQTAVPAGLLLAGLVGPLLNDWVGWRGAMLITAGICVVTACGLQPLRREFDDDRDRTASFHVSDLKGTLMSVLEPPLRTLAYACFALNAMQVVFTTYFVLYLTHLGYTLAAAGVIFSVATAVAMPGRIFWGWLSSGHVKPFVVLSGLSFAVVASSVFLALYEPTWAVIAIGVGAVAMSGTVLSWHGVVLAEAARLAPEGKRAAVTGGVLSFGQLGSMSMPLVYAALLSATGSYGIGFIACGVPVLMVAFDLLRVERKARVA